MALTVLTDGSTASNTRTLTWTIPTLAVGDVVVVAAVTWDQGNTLNPPSGTGLTFTARVTANAGNRDRVYIWTAVASSGGSSVVVTSSVLAGGANMHSGVLYVCPTADGYSLAASPNTLSNAAVTNGTAGQGSLSGASGNLGIVVVGDWNGTSGASRAWLVSATEDDYQFSNTTNTQYFAHCTLTGASTTVGLSAPTTGTSNTIGAVEVLKSGGGGPTNYNGTASLSGTGSISTGGEVGKVASASLSGSGSLSGAGVVGKVAGATLAGTDAISAAGSVTSGSSTGSTLTGTGTIAAGGVVGLSATATLAGTGAVTDGGTRGLVAGATLAGTDTITAAGTTVSGLTRTASLSGTLAITTAGVVGLSTSAALVGTAGISDAGTMAASGGAVLAGTGLIVAAGSSTQRQHFFTPPTIEVPIYSLTAPLSRFRITQGVSIVRTNGVFREVRIPTLEQLEAAGTAGVDYFIGGYRYEITAETAAELQAAGYTVSE